MSLFTPRIIKKLKKSGLIGRGCNSFPTWQKWTMVRQAKAKQKFVICNGSESEPGVFKDEYLLARFPDKIINGLKIALKTLKAHKGFIYLNPEYYDKFSANLNELIKKENLPIELYKKPSHDYIGGEETAAINSLVGWRVEPKLKPPFPTLRGFENSPTLINNCETFYAVSLINSGAYKNTRFYCFSEFDLNEKKYRNQKILELPLGITILQALKEFKHQPSEKYFYQIGGGAGGDCFNHKQLNKPFSGLASIIAYDKNIPEKDIILHWANFFTHESCGQCVPCREGTYRLRELLEKKYLTDEFDQKLFNEIVSSLQNSSFCALGKISADAILSYWKNVNKK
jgi:NADH:ubiquinone oxidoreductase subunit F (NADH-binding)